MLANTSGPSPELRSAALWPTVGALRSRAGLKSFGVTPHAQAGRSLLGTNRPSGRLAHLLRHGGPAL